MSHTMVVRRPAPSLLARLGHSIRNYVVSGLSLKDPALTKYFMTGPPSYAGIPVTQENALTYSAVFDAVNQISSDVAKLPLNLLKRIKGGGSEPYTDSKVFDLLKYEPNPEMGSMVFRRTITAHALTCSGGYAEIERNGLGRPVALWPITPDRMQPYRDTSDGRAYGPLKYRVDGKIELAGDDVIHIHGLGYDGYVGYSVIDKARQAIGLALAAEKFGAEFFSSGASIGGILTSDQNYPDEEQEKNVREAMTSYQAKAGRMRQFLLLFGGEWKFEKTGITPNESQMDELRSRQIAEVARFFNMPIHKLKDLDRATNNNIEQQDLEYYKGCLLTWITLWEEEINRKLISPLERTQQYVKHNANAFLRGDIQSRFTALGIARDKGIINADEWRDLEDMNPQAGGQGKLYLVQTAQVPLDKIAELTQSQIDKNNAPPPPPPTPPPSGDAAAGDQAVKDANARADAADLLAREAREALVAAETTLAEHLAFGTAKDADLAALREQVNAQAVAAGQFDLMAAELRRAADAAQSDAVAVAEKLTESERLKAEAEQRAIAADERATSAEAESQMAKHEAAAALENARILGAISAEAQRAADSAREAAGLSSEQRLEAQRVALEAKALAELATAEATDSRAKAEAASEAEQAARALADAKAAEAEALGVALEREDDARVEAERRVSAIRIETDAQIAAADMRIAELNSLHQLAVADAEAKAGELAAAIAGEGIMRAELASLALSYDSEAKAREQSAEREAIATEAAEKATAEAESLRASLADAVAAREQAQTERRQIEQADADGIAATVAAHRGLVVDIMRRMVERETDRARRAQATPEKLRKWLETFYDGHEDLLRTALLPAVRIHLAFLRSSEDPIDASRRLAAAHVDESRRQLMTVLDGDADDLAPSLTALLYRWDSERPSAIADLLLQKELDHVRRR